MNKKQIFRAAGAFLLVAVGAFAGRASSKKSAPSVLYYSTGTANSCTILQGSVSGATVLTTIGTGTQAKLLTAGGVHSWKIYATSTCTASHKVYFPG